MTTAKDAIAPAEAALENARRTYERRQGLYAKGGISKKDLESSQLDVSNAQGALKTANSKIGEASDHLASLDAQLSYSAVRAPFDGIVTDQFAYQGDFATPGNKLLTIADTSTVIVKAPLSADAAVRVHPATSPRCCRTIAAGHHAAGAGQSGRTLRPIRRAARSRSG